MSESLGRRHALEGFLDRAVAAGGENAGVNVEIRPQLDYINLRGDPGSEEFLSATQGALNRDLPLAANTMAIGAATAYWLAPDEWLLTTAAGGGVELAETLEKALGGMHASVNQMNGGYITLRISGVDSTTVLAKGCTLDLHPRTFSIGQCAQSGLGKANVLIARVDDEPSFELVVRRSFAEYLVLWLQNAGAEFGISFSSAE